MHLISFVNMFRNNPGYHEASLEGGGGIYVVYYVQNVH